MAALELLATISVDLAIIDVHMPVMNGVELIKRLRAMSGLERLPVFRRAIQARSRRRCGEI